MTVRRKLFLVWFTVNYREVLLFLDVYFVFVQLTFEDQNLRNFMLKCKIKEGVTLVSLG